MQIDIWSDLACPWCPIGKRRSDRVPDAFPHRDRVRVTCRGFPLDPSLPESWDGTEAQHLAQVEGLPHDVDALVVAGARKAHALLQAALTVPVPDAQCGPAGCSLRIARGFLDVSSDLPPEGSGRGRTVVS